MGQVISPGSIEVAPKAADAIKKLKDPKNITELQSFLGICNVFRHFFPNFSRIYAPLNMKVRKEQPTNFNVLSPEQKKELFTMKERLVKTPLLALPKSNRKFTVDTEACDRQVGYVLLHEKVEGTKNPIGYWSKSLTPTERSYDKTKREFIAVVWELLLLRK